MKKCKIVTFSNSINYGAILQAYALQEVCSRFADVQIINYKYESQKPKVKTPYAKKILYIVKKFLSKNFLYFMKNSKVERDKKRLLKHTKSYTNSTIKNIEQKDTVFIVGSDQVWNCNIHNMDGVFFLDFVIDGKAKNSYAASFGIDHVPDKYFDDYKNFLKDFNKIAVRESQGQSLVKELIGKDVDVTLDPTLLLDKDNWNSLLSNEIKKEEPYILIYTLERSNSLLKFAEMLSKKYNMKIKYLSTSLRKQINAEVIYSAGPIDFIRLFSNASYIVTNSFHGTVFSINFNKPFFVELLINSHKVNSRLEHILNVLDLNERKIENGECKNLDKAINYEVVNKTLNELKKDSLSYIESIFKDE
jgi:polysaccharide pyruvyl transferase WcaK-like protein